MPNVGRITDLGSLAVARNVHMRGLLLLHDIDGPLRHRFLESLLVVAFSAVLREQKIDDILRTRQAAYVRS